MDRTSLSRALLEAPHKKICDQGGSPQISLRTKKPPGLPNRTPLQTQGLPSSSQGSSSQAKLCATNLQAELRPGGLPTSRITTRELAGWLAGGIATREPAAGWLVEEAQRGPKRGGQRGPKRRSGDGTSLPGVWLEAPTSRFTTREAPHRFLYGTPEETPRGLLRTGFQNRIPLQTQCLPTSRTVYVCMLCMYDQEAPHKQNYDRGGRITTREVELQPELFL